MPLILPCEDTYTTHPAAFTKSFYKYKNNRYSDEDILRCPTAAAACILGLCIHQSGVFGRWIMDKWESK